MKNLIQYVLFLILSFSASLAWSAHIIGGEMYYQCLGYGNNGQDTTSRVYRIFIKLYRDCRPQQQAAGFDVPLGFTIFRKMANGSYVNVLPANQEYSIPRLSQGPDQIDPPDYPCLILPPNICVESGTYQHDVTLPIIQSEYVIVWQRCCRNNTISNIQNPGGTGATWSISIHPEAQRTCNSSPRFINFPPTVVCVNNPLNFDHGAIDAEGDYLLYSFCEPLAGGGQGQGGNNCNAVVPTPDCPPPFPLVQFRAPLYTYLFPMGGNPPVTINSLTGRITGEPNTIGQFVMSICVSEYRNGVLLSTLRRDFQFNVASCQGTVVAQLGTGTLTRKKHHSILLCNDTILQMQNNSYQQQFISEVLWEYENGGKMDSFMGWAPTIHFKEGGIHKGRFILNPGTNCSDTFGFDVNVIPPIQPDFSFSFDSCKAGPVSFSDQTYSKYSNIRTWDWDFGDGFRGFSKNMEINYIHPDRYTIQLEVTDEFGCKSRIQKGLLWQPAPDVIIFEPSLREGCVPLKVGFKNISFPTDSTYQFRWKFSNGVIRSGTSFVQVFDSVGSYDLNLEVVSPLGCKSSADFSQVVSVYPPPSANAVVDPLIVNIDTPFVLLTDLSPNTNGRTWIIDGKEFYFDRDLQYQFEDTGWHSVRLIASDRFLCTDTLDFRVFVFRDFSLYMPNAFSPNGDAINEDFKPVGQLRDLVKYDLQIFDRWGGKVFESRVADKGWNGKMNNEGSDLPPGTYIYELYYQAANKEAVKEKKQLMLIR
ncbi:MAG: gliding motility-associated C-terminal domain-containing protein [Saprospiraceae bacterium]|nr:gliding motility-associated C-terminal domain-containing protein [Saprospiraceae bacterium]